VHYTPNNQERYQKQGKKQGTGEPGRGPCSSKKTRKNIASTVKGYMNVSAFQMQGPSKLYRASVAPLLNKRNILDQQI
jgi:hypothetical protein